MEKRKSKRKSAIVKSKATPPPEIYVKIANDKASWRYFSQYARAHLRIKSGKYVYLEWRENARIRSLYLGSRRAQFKKA